MKGEPVTADHDSPRALQSAPFEPLSQERFLRLLVEGDGKGWPRRSTRTSRPQPDVALSGILITCGACADDSFVERIRDRII